MKKLLEGNDVLDVSQDFIEENKKIDLVKPRQKFAPYTRSQRRKRRVEVYRLHFEQGMPAIRIAEVMKVDRNTIVSDLKILYHEAAKEWDQSSFQDFLYKQLTRLETQRDRLSTYLAKSSKDIEKQLAVERLIADIDFKILAAIERMNFGSIASWERIIKGINQLGKKENISYTSLFEIWQISRKSRKRLDDIIKEAKSA